MFLVPVTSSSPRRQDTAPLAPSFIHSQSVGLNPSTFITETGQDVPQLHSAVGCPPGASPTGAWLRVAASHALEHKPFYGLSNWAHNHRGALGCRVDTGLNRHSSVITTKLSPPSQVVPGACRVCKGREKSVCYLPIQPLIPPPNSSTAPPSEQDGALTCSDKSFCFPSAKPITKRQSHAPAGLGPP